MATITALAGCSESLSGVTGGLEIENVDSRTTSLGDIVLTVTITNDSGSSKSSTLIGQVDISGGDTYTKRRDVTVTGDSSNTFDLGFDISFSDSLSANQYEYDTELEE
ncbi:hypothetical protein [Natrinema salsiterrestre]|uniref:Uncharacterized protein n=1 Tax=Natrinema salsiterrestre TaxID=2950540 RepID=A0A9Q4Q2K9_9EURY|nr:hypothetical protein [Natrinema salsiterrestre]MDF9745353.1 hypothetical protein [Natrinema salsiterrestre]